MNYALNIGYAEVHYYGMLQSFVSISVLYVYGKQCNRVLNVAIKFNDYDSNNVCMQVLTTRIVSIST